MNSNLGSRLLLLFIVFNSLEVLLVSGQGKPHAAGSNPLSPYRSLMRYWRRKTNNSPKPAFLIRKSSPLTFEQCALFQNLADKQSLSAQLPDFCAKANLFCFSDPNSDRPAGNGPFTAYHNKNFTNYGGEAFKAYAQNESTSLDTFQSYNKGAVNRNDSFTGYASKADAVDQSFTSYGNDSSSGQSEFSTYDSQTNVPDLRFTTYSENSNHRVQSFTEYSNGANVGDEKFTTYGNGGKTPENKFSNYGNGSKEIASSFAAYALANSTKDTFTSYGESADIPDSSFRNYGTGVDNPTETFKSYRQSANEGIDDFKNYAQNESTGGTLDFETYGKLIDDPGKEKFSSYGRNVTADFNGYNSNHSFSEYSNMAEGSTNFNIYIFNETTMNVSLLNETSRKISKSFVEPGKFFKEVMLKTGTVIPMPDFRDKMPKRSFLPRSLASKMPFSTERINELKRIFHATSKSKMEDMIVDTLDECEREPAAGETKRCATSIEDILDFATTVLGNNVVVRSMENTQGYSRNVILGQVRGINGGKVTRSVSCHASLFPYMVYYCHSIPNVRVYEADILDSQSKAKINHGVAVCHLDTSEWSPTHGAFVALDSTPGQTEVCHWIYENDMSWTTKD